MNGPFRERSTQIGITSLWLIGMAGCAIFVRKQGWRIDTNIEPILI